MPVRLFVDADWSKRWRRSVQDEKRRLRCLSSKSWSLCPSWQRQPARDPDLAQDLAQHFRPEGMMHWIVVSVAEIILMWLACRTTHWWLTRGVWNRELMDKQSVR
jgi:hypothetical protein